MINYNKLSKDELIKLLQAKDNQIDKLTIELRDTREKLDKLIIKYENQQQRAARDAYNKFVGTKEALEPIEECINEAEATKPRVGREKGGKILIIN